MKVIAPYNIEHMLQNIISEKVRQANKAQKQFRGVPSSEVFSDLNRMIGDEWVLVKPPSLQPEDMKAVANSRFNRKVGIKLLMLLTIIMLGLATVTRTFPILPAWAFYSLLGISAFVILSIYTKKQRDAQKEMWMTGGDFDSDKVK